MMTGRRLAAVPGLFHLDLAPARLGVNHDAQRNIGRLFKPFGSFKVYEQICRLEDGL